MSKVSKGVRNLKLGPIVAQLVQMAEVVLGGGTGALKKQLVMAVIAMVVRKAQEAGQQTPENAVGLADELVEQTLLIQKTYANGQTVILPVELAKEMPSVTATPATIAPTKGRGGRKPGSKNKPKATVTTTGGSVTYRPTTETTDDDDVIDVTGFDLDE